VTHYPSVEDVLAAQDEVLGRFGGGAGLRDRAALESALARPRSGYYLDLIQQAAALWESLSENHAFLDGNKRVALVVTAAFLRVNGFRLSFDDQAAFDFLMGLYQTGRFGFEQIEPWLRRHVSTTGT
jgi:death-on-curing protein